MSLFIFFGAPATTVRQTQGSAFCIRQIFLSNFSAPSLPSVFGKGHTGKGGGLPRASGRRVWRDSSVRQRHPPSLPGPHFLAATNRGFLCQKMKPQDRIRRWSEIGRQTPNTTHSLPRSYAFFATVSHNTARKKNKQNEIWCTLGPFFGCVRRVGHHSAPQWSST